MHDGFSSAIWPKAILLCQFLGLDVVFFYLPDVFIDSYIFDIINTEKISMVFSSVFCLLDVMKAAIYVDS